MQHVVSNMVWANNSALLKFSAVLLFVVVTRVSLCLDRPWLPVPRYTSPGQPNSSRGLA